MAEAHPTPVPAADSTPVAGPQSDPVPNDVDVLKRELIDVRMTLECLKKTVENLTGVKVEAVPSILPTKIEVKNEFLEIELGDILGVIPTSAQQDVSDNDRIEVEDEEIEQDNRPENASHNGGEEIAVASPRRESTEELIWATPPPGGEVLFRVNPEYAQRMALRNGTATEPVRVPTPPRTREEASPPPPRSLLPPPVARLTTPAETAPAPQAKRKYTFELIIEVPSKRFKASTSLDPPTSSSSHNVSGKSNEVTTNSTVQKRRTNPGKKRTIRKLTVTPFDVTLQPQIRDVLVSRSFLATHFGANPTHTFTQCQKHRIAKHGYDHFGFVCEANSPQVPSAPGKPGIVINFEGNLWPKLDLYRLFVRMSTCPARWQYMGLYKAKILPPWSPAEVKKQRRMIGSGWARRVKDSVWGRPIIARIMLRNTLGREPTRAEVNDRVEKLKEKNAEFPHTRVVVAAFEKGEEKVYAWELECKGYEEDLQWEIAVTFPHFKKDARNKFNTSTHT